MDHPEFEKIDVSRLARAVGEVVSSISASGRHNATEVLLSLENSLKDIILVMCDYVTKLGQNGIVVAPRWSSIDRMLLSRFWEKQIPPYVEEDMSKKDYEAIAKALDQCRPSRNEEQRPGWTLAVNALLKVFGEENPRFDPIKFVRACHATDLENRDPDVDWPAYHRPTS